MRVQPGDDAHDTQGKGILNLQPMWVQRAVCRLLAPNVGSWPVLVRWFGSAIQVYIGVYV
jgi:hypothetical protein